MRGQSLTRTSCFVLCMLLVSMIAFGASSGTTSSNPEESYMMRILDRTFTETSDAIITAQLDRMTWGSGEETQRLNLRILPKSGFIIFSGLMNVFFDCMNAEHITTGTPEIDVLVEYPSGESKWIPYGDFKELESVVKFFSLSSLASAGINIITAPHSLVYRMEVAIEAVDKALELLKLGAQSNWKEGGPPGSRYLMSGIAGIGAHLETCQIRGYWITMPLYNMGDKNCTLDTYVSFQQYFVNSGTYSAEFSLEVPPEETRVSEITVTKIAGQQGEIQTITNTFQWTGHDPDGHITRYEYRKDKGQWQVIQDFSIEEDFETGNFDRHRWELGGNIAPYIQQQETYEGRHAVRFGNITHNQKSYLEITLDIPQDTEVSFYYKVSSESDYDFLCFYIDGQRIARWSGETGWNRYETELKAGTRTLRWSYEKDESESHRQDTAWIDNIVIGQDTDIFSYTWRGYEEGEHIFEVRARDNEGKYSEPVLWSFSYAKAGLDLVFEDDFYSGLHKWNLFGSPLPIIRSNVYGADFAFDNRGDSWHNSGAYSKERFSSIESLVLRSRVYIDFSNRDGCWNAVTIGLSTGQPAEDRTNRLVHFAIACEGEACWMTPAEHRRKSYVRIAYEGETSGHVRNFYDWSESREWIADDYLQKWIVMEIAIDAQGIPRFYIDDELIFVGPESVNWLLFDDFVIYLGNRSSGSAGRCYHDWVIMKTQ